MIVAEAFGSGNLSSGRNASGERRYVVTGVDLAGDDEGDVRDAVAAVAPDTFDGLKRRTIAVEQLANDVWTAVVSYSPIEASPPVNHADWVTQFSTNGSTETVQLALAQTGTSLVTALAAPDFGRNINVDLDGNPQGVEIVVPRFEFSETHYVPSSTFPGSGNAGILALHNATGKTNSGTFRGFSAQSVLFLGASGAKRPAEGDWEITYSFSASPNATLSFPRYDAAGAADGNATVAKNGHDYVWFWHERREDATAGATVSRARAAYVSRVYETTAFTGAGGFMPQ